MSSPRLMPLVNNTLADSATGPDSTVRTLMHAALLAAQGPGRGIARFARTPPLLLAFAVVALGYVFGYEFWSARLGPLPLTFDRIGVLLLAGVVAWRVRSGSALRPHWTLVDWVLGGTLVWLALSALLGSVAGDGMAPQSPLWRLVFSFWLPALLFVAIRLGEVTPRITTAVLAMLTFLGVYLAITALAEVTQQWWCVFPTYIRDPELGTHFGRARGPALNSVSLGTHLAICLWAAFTLRERVGRLGRPLLWSLMGLMAVAILATYTRSVWLGMGLSALVVLGVKTPRHLRLPVLGGAVLVGAIVAIASWNYIVYLDREDSGVVSGHSVSQREAFTYVSWNMFRDHPALGVGFGRFYDRKLPYLSDRRQPFEIESLRDLHHHNTFLGLLVETGLIGMAGYTALLLGWGRIGACMATGALQHPAHRSIGCFCLATLAVYLPSALFHDVSLIFQDQWLLFAVTGLAVATWEQSGLQPATCRDPESSSSSFSRLLQTS